MKKLPSGGYEVGHSAQVIGFDRTSGVVLWTPETPIADLKHDFGLLVETVPCDPWVSTRRARPVLGGVLAARRGRSRSPIRRPRWPRSGRTSCSRPAWRPSSAGACRSSRSRSACCCWPAWPPVRPAAAAAALLLVLVVAAVASAAVRGLSIDCGCFGGGGPVPPGETAYGAEIVRDLGLLAAGRLAGRPAGRAGSAWSGRDEPRPRAGRSPAPGALDPAGRAGRPGRGGGRRRHRAPGLADQPGSGGRCRSPSLSAARRRRSPRAGRSSFGERIRPGGGHPVRRLPLPALRRVRGGVRPGARRRPGRAAGSGSRSTRWPSSTRARRRRPTPSPVPPRPASARLLRRSVRQPDPDAGATTSWSLWPGRSGATASPEFARVRDQAGPRRLGRLDQRGGRAARGHRHPDPAGRRCAAVDLTKLTPDGLAAMINS